MTAPMICADAPELLALVGAAKDALTVLEEYNIGLSSPVICDLVPALAAELATTRDERDEALTELASLRKEVERLRGAESDILDRVIEGSVWSMPSGTTATDEWRRGVTDARRDISQHVRAGFTAEPLGHGVTADDFGGEA